MAHQVTGSSAMAVGWILLIFAYFIVGLRIWISISHQRSQLALSDAFVLVAAANALGLIICDTLTYRAGALRDDFKGPYTSSYMKVSFASNYFYDTGIYFPKLSLIALYFTLIPPAMRTLRVLLYIVTGFVSIATIATSMMDTWWCGAHISKNWDPHAKCSSFFSIILFTVNWALNISSSILIFMLPLPLLRRFRALPKSQYVGLICTFLLGLVTMAMSALRFTTVKFTNNFVSFYILGMAEMSTSLIVVSLPTLRPLLQNASEPSPGSESRSWFSTMASKLRAPAKAVTSITSSRIDRGEPFRMPSENGSQVNLNNASAIKLNAIYREQHYSIHSSHLSPDWTPPPEPLGERLDLEGRPHGMGTSAKAYV